MPHIEGEIQIENTTRLAQDQGFSLRETVGAILRGWILVQQGEAQGGIEQLHQSMHAFRATGAEVLRPLCSAKTPLASRWWTTPFLPATIDRDDHACHRRIPD